MNRWDASHWLWSEACAAFERMEGLRRRAFQPAIGRPAWEPPVDVAELGDRVVVLVALPGVDNASVEVTLESGVLSIFGYRPMPAELRHGEIHVLEIPWGRFCRRIALPRTDLSPESCAMADGCLRIVLGRAGRTRPAAAPKGTRP